MRNLLAAALFSTAMLACTKTPDNTAPAATDPVPAAATAPPATAPAPTPAPAPAAAPAPAPAAAVAVAAADDSTPDLVEAAPGVQVIADYDAPVFYTSGAYWRHNDNGWYSSSNYRGGWEFKATPPSVIVSIDRPEHYVHYRPSGYVVRHHAAPQREWNPAPIHAEAHAQVHVDPRVEVRAPHVEVHVPQVEVHVPKVEIHVPQIHVEPPRVGVHVESHAEVHTGR